MSEFKNNFLNCCINKRSKNYVNIAKKMATLHAKCFEHSKHHLNHKSMLFFLKNAKSHLFYNEISLAIVQVAGLEADLITLMVDPKNQKKQMGSNILEMISLYLKDLGVKYLFLEVAANNQAALKMYHKFNFKSCGTRKNYYMQVNGTKCDATIMVSNLSRKNGKIDKKKLQMLYPTG